MIAVVGCFVDVEEFCVDIGASVGFVGLKELINVPSVVNELISIISDVDVLVCPLSDVVGVILSDVDELAVPLSVAGVSIGIMTGTSVLALLVLSPVPGVDVLPFP